MFIINKSRWSKIIFVLLVFTIIEKGWVTKIRPAVELGTIFVTQEALSAVVLAASFLWRAYSNSNDSAVDHLFGQEIDRLNNYNGAAKQASAHSTVSVHSPQHISPPVITQQVKPISTTKPVANVQNVSSSTTKPGTVVQNVSSAQKKSGQKISKASAHVSDFSDKARAVVSPVASEHAVPAIHVVANEFQKIAAQELVNNVAVDWHKQVERCSRELVRSTRAQIFNRVEINAQEWGSEYTYETHSNGGVTYYAPNRNISFYVGPSTRQDAHSLADDIAQQQLEEKIQIACDPFLQTAIHQELLAFINTAHSLVYGTLHERIAALVCLADFHVGGIVYGQPLNDVQRQIYAKYAYADGSICIAKLFDMSDAHGIIKKYVARQEKIAPLFKEPCEIIKQPINGQLIKKTKKVDLDVIRNNPINQCYRQMLVAFASGDMRQVERIKNNNTQLKELPILYDSLKSEYDKIVLKQESLLKDEYGIVHFNLPAEHRDSVYTALSKRSREQLQSNPSALANFNDMLKLRQLYKNALHKAWNIPTTAIPVVHQALYSLIDIDTIPERINKIHELSTNNKISVSEQQSLVRALFLPSGIIKDFSSYDRAKSLSMSSAILRPEQAKTRILLNQLVYAEHAGNDDQIKSKYAAAIECIQKSMATDNQESFVHYLAKARVLYDRIVNSCAANVQGLDDEIDHENAGCLSSPKEEPYVDEKIRRTCGTGQIKDKPLTVGSCLPEVGKNFKLSLCPEQKNSIEQGSHDAHINEPDVKQQPCGHQGQALPGFESDNVPVSESEDIGHKGESEDIESTDESEGIESDEGESGQVGISTDSGEIEAENDTSYGVAVSESSEFEVAADNIAANKTIKTVQDLIDESQLFEEPSELNIQYKRPGTYAEAVKDFESLNPSNIRDLQGSNPGRRGILPDGRDVIVRLKSSKKCYPTLEIQHNPHKNKIKFRYMGDQY